MAAEKNGNYNAPFISPCRATLANHDNIQAESILVLAETPSAVKCGSEFPGYCNRLLKIAFYCGPKTSGRTEVGRCRNLVAGVTQGLALALGVVVALGVAVVLGVAIVEGASASNTLILRFCPPG
jgi:hypothetical protein